MRKAGTYWPIEIRKRVSKSLENYINSGGGLAEFRRNIKKLCPEEVRKCPDLTEIPYHTLRYWIPNIKEIELKKHWAKIKKDAPKFGLTKNLEECLSSAYIYITRDDFLKDIITHLSRRRCDEFSLCERLYGREIIFSSKRMRYVEKVRGAIYHLTLAGLVKKHNK